MIAMTLFELNLFVWIIYCCWDHYIGDEDKKMEKKVLPKFDCFSDPATAVKNNSTQRYLRVSEN